jgi:quercetin dioxygenase-like cupin family protein
MLSGVFLLLFAFCLRYNEAQSVQRTKDKHMNEKIIHVEKWQNPHPPTEQELLELMYADNLVPYRWANDPHDVYPAHVHDYDKIIFVVSGSITFGFPVEGEPTILHAGDRLDLPAGIRHNAAVGPDGVVCLEAHGS